MTFKIIAAASCAIVALGAGSAAFAQQRPATTPAAPAAAAPAVTHGAPVNGICVVSVDAVVGASTVGRHVQTRLQQLVQQVNAELNGERTAIQNEAKTLEGQGATLDRTVLEQRAAALQVRDNALQRKAQLREREIAATQQKAVSRVLQEADPLVRQAYQQKGCSVLLSREALVLPANPAMDITPQVTAALNAKITQFAFDRERLDTAAAAPAAARPAAATPTPPATTRR